MQTQKVEENENLKPALRKEGRIRTYSKGDSDMIDLICSLPQVQRWVSLEKLMRDESKGLERSKRKGKSWVLERTVAQVKMRLDYLLFL